MRLITVIKPWKSEGCSIDSIKSKHQMYGFTCSSLYGDYYGDHKDFIMVANFQKVNTKTKQVKKKVKGEMKTVSTVVRYAHWEAFIYKIPKSWLEQNKKKVIQKKRNFVIVDRK